jgi:type III restriction enzyme
MKLQFDPNQQYQLDAVAAVVDIFEGQPETSSDFSVIQSHWGDDNLYTGIVRTELGIANRLVLSDDSLWKNTQAVQTLNDIETPENKKELDAWRFEDAVSKTNRICPHFSVEMETGTGKTYVYLRTVFELSRRYGFKKFIVVVPSVAIREGVLKNIEITADHFRSLYDNMPFEHFVYDGRKDNRMRQFAVSNTLQLLIINIDAFRKNFTGTDEEQKSNVIYKESDRLSGRQPIEFIHSTRPIVIIDEPQSVDSTEKSQEAIKALNPMCTLRYSATHRNPYNLVYRLDPVRAFELKLVKQIVVAGAAADGGANNAFVRVEQIDNKKGIRAKVRIHTQTNDGPKEKSLWVKQGDDLFTKSNERHVYGNGFEIAEINAEPQNEYLRFSNGNSLRLGEEIGGMSDDVQKIQIRHTVKRHLEKELQLKGRGIKVLSLFFIDRVANYRDYDDSDKPVPGKFAKELEDALFSFAKETRYASIPWLKESVGRLHNGYFAADRKGNLKDTNGKTKDDDDAYTLIMKDKERLLSEEEPLRFIFSHSALREGWDNPNVFQICTLNETRSSVKKRQEIGRGMRLPVDQKGRRIFDDSVNRLFVMANESYEDFARSLQTEYEEDCGVTFGKIPITAIAKLTLVSEDGIERLVGREEAERVKQTLVEAHILDADGRIQPGIDPRQPDFSLKLDEEHKQLESAMVDLLSVYSIEKHIRREKDERPNHLKKEVRHSPEFLALWDRIKPRTTYRTEFETAKLIERAADAVSEMEKIEKPKVRVSAGQLDIQKGGVTTQAVSVAEEALPYGARRCPDILAYLQNETELTRSTLTAILKKSKRLNEFFFDPQRFMDHASELIKHELHQLLVEGIKYEKLTGVGSDYEWEQVLCDDHEIVDYLNAVKVEKSVQEYVVYDSEIERRFAEQLDQREDIKLFIKLPRKFIVDTPVGGYNPDWAILKQDGHAFYLVRETKGTKDLFKLRTSEADKIRCGEKHFEAIGVSFAVVVSAAEV